MFPSIAVIFLIKVAILTQKKSLQISSEFFLIALLSNMITLFQDYLIYFLTQNYKYAFLRGTLIPFSDKWYLETKIRVWGLLITTCLEVISKLGLF